MGIRPKDASSLAEARGFVQEFKNRLSACVDANDLGCRSKLPFKVLSLREPLLYRVTEIGESACRLYEANMMASAFTLTRSALETSAMLHWLYKQMEQTVKAGKIGKDLDVVLMRALLGRKDRHIQPINVTTFIDHLDKRFKDADINQTYFDLSEYAHPNWFGVMSLYGRQELSVGRLNLGWPEEGARLGEGLPLLCMALGIFKFFYEETSRLLPGFMDVCDKSLS